MQQSVFAITLQKNRPTRQVTSDLAGSRPTVGPQEMLILSKEVRVEEKNEFFGKIEDLFWIMNSRLTKN